MIVQVFEMYSDDCDCNGYEEAEADLVLNVKTIHTNLPLSRVVAG